MRKASLDAGEHLLAYLKGLLFESLYEPKVYCSMEPETENLMKKKKRRKKKKEDDDDDNAIKTLVVGSSKIMRIII